MGVVRQVPSLLGGTLRLVEVLEATIVHTIRHDTGRSALGFISALGRPLAMLAMFWLMIELSGARGLTIRGNVITFLLTGIFCFLVHIGTMQKVAHALKKARNMLHHAPATIFLYVLSQAFGTLYLHLFASLTIVGVAELAGMDLGIKNPAGLILPYFLSWLSGMGMGMIIMALSHVAPTGSEVFMTVYTRAQFVTSGKFWAANIMPAYLADYAIWNPLLHIIDQMRGAAFVNYFPKFTNIGFPLVFSAIVVLLGFMLESWIRRSYSMSRGKR